MRRSILFIVGVFSFWALLWATSAWAEVRVVTKTADTNDGVCDGDCSLREAIAVAQPGDVIQFQGGGVGTHQLEPGALGITKDNITIDGGEGHQVVIRGKHAEFAAANNLKGSFNCFTVKSSNNTFKGLVIQNCYFGIIIFGSRRDLAEGQVECTSPKGNRIEHNYIGTNLTGDKAVANFMGIRISNGQENIVGPANVLSGNMYGLYLDDPCTRLNRIEGNIIGLKANGSEALQNTRYGVVVTMGAVANIIGGETPRQRNIISGNNWLGILINYSAKFNQVVGNYIGLDKEGKKAHGNGKGIHIGNDHAQWKTQNNRVAGNVITGNNIGLYLFGVGTENNIVEKNIIGLGEDLNTITGLESVGAGIGNAQYGIVLRASRNVIGGEDLENANIISKNGIFGIFVGEVRFNLGDQMVAPAAAVGNKFLYNLIYENGRVAIQFDPEGQPSHNNISKPNNFSLPDDTPLVQDEVTLRGNGTKPAVTVYLYEADAADSCEGKTLLAKLQAGDDGGWETKLTGRLNDPGIQVVAVQNSDADGFSEFSNCFEIENEKPKLNNPGERGVTELQTLSFILNAVDPNGDKIQYACVGECPEGLEVDRDTGEVTWTPELGKKGQYSASFAATDGVHSDEINVPITVEELDTTPQLADIGDWEIFVNENLTFQLEAADEDGDELRFKMAEGLKEGMTFVEEAGTFAWEPTKGDIGEHRLVFRALDDDKELLFTEKVANIEVKRKKGEPVVEVEGKKIVSAGQSIPLVAKLKEQYPDTQYIYRWELTSGEGAVSDPSSPEIEFIAPLSEENHEEIITLVVEDDEGNVTTKTFSVLVLAKSAEVLTVESPTAGGDEMLLGDVEHGEGELGEEEVTEKGEEVTEEGEVGGILRCSLSTSAVGPANLGILWLLPFLLLAYRHRLHIKEKSKE